MPRKRLRTISGLGCPMRWSEIWGAPAADELDLSDKHLAPGSKRTKLFEYDSDSENEDIAKQLVAKHFEEECGMKGERKIADSKRLMELYSMEELAELRAELRQRSSSSHAYDPEPLAEEDVEGDVSQYERELGCRIEPFHMREERAVGHFDAAGFWVRDEADSSTDAWLRSLDETGAPAAVVAVRPSPSTPAPRSGLPAPLPPSVGEDFAQVLRIVRCGETIGTALWRLKGAKKKKVPTSRPKEDIGPDDDRPLYSAEFDCLVEAADRLVDSGAYQLWDTSYDGLQELAAAAQRGEQESRERAERARKAEVLWEYVWSKGVGAEVHGPFTASVMHGWKQAQYFSPQQVAYVRPVMQDMFALEEPEWCEAHTVDYFM